MATGWALAFDGAEACWVTSGLMATPSPKPNDPLHGVTLEMMLKRLVNKYGWDGLAKRVRINCLKNDPTIPSVLNFLRKTPWARAKVEALYVHTWRRSRGL